MHDNALEADVRKSFIIARNASSKKKIQFFHGRNSCIPIMWRRGMTHVGSAQYSIGG